MSIKDIVIAALPSFLKAYAKKIEASPLGYRLARGAFWSMAGAVISRGLGIASSVVVARTLGKVGFGELGIINSTVMMFEIFAGFSLGKTATRYVAEFRCTDPQKAGRIIAMAWVVSACTGGLCAGLLFIFAPWLASHTLAAPHLGGLLKIASVIIFISALNGAQWGALSGFEAFKKIATINLVAGVLNFPLMVAGVLLAGLKGIVWAMVASQAANWLLCHLAVRYEARRFGVPLRFSGYTQEIPILWRFSIPAVLSGLMVTPVNWVCNTLLVNQANGYAEMGLLNAANQWYNALLFAPTVLSSSIFPVLSERLTSGAIKQSNRILIFAIGIIAVTVFPITAGGCVASPLIMGLYGKTFISGWPVLIMMLIAANVLALQQPACQVIAASGKMWGGFVICLLWGIVLVSTTALLVGRGALGVASARLFACIWHGLLTSGYVYIITKKVE
ncbi:MAG: oligosaccharide flippase family protein [Planctomycetota bacterium]|nr:oligosaccharide flippase family protein [Planctomycetota bacterium]